MCLCGALRNGQSARTIDGADPKLSVLPSCVRPRLVGVVLPRLSTEGAGTHAGPFDVGRPNPCTGSGVRLPWFVIRGPPLAWTSLVVAFRSGSFAFLCRPDRIELGKLQSVTPNHRVDRSGVWVRRDGWSVLSPLGHPGRSVDRDPHRVTRVS